MAHTVCRKLHVSTVIRFRVTHQTNKKKKNRIDFVKTWFYINISGFLRCFAYFFRLF